MWRRLISFANELVDVTVSMQRYELLLYRAVPNLNPCVYRENIKFLLDENEFQLNRALLIF